MEFEDFDDLIVSSKTYTIQPNFKIDLSELFELIPITPYVMIEKRRGRKKKGLEKEHNNDIPYGSFISVKFKNKLRGIDLKKKNTKKDIASMRNSMSIDIILDKRINFKIYCNGTFQLTGCKTYLHTYKCIEYIWNIIKNNKNLYTMIKSDDDIPKAVIIPAMRNVNFSLGFTVDREKMMTEKRRMNSAYCYLEISCTYTGLTLKIPLDKDIRDIETYSIIYDKDTDKWDIKKAKYGEYLDTLPQKVLEEKLKQKRYNTFIIFYSGTTIMTGITRDCMRDAYDEFISIIKNNYDNFVERLEDKGVISDNLSDSTTE